MYSGMDDRLYRLGYKKKPRFINKVVSYNTTVTRVILSLIVIAAIAALDKLISRYSFGEAVLNQLDSVIGSGYGDLLFTCLSLTFITISISSVLSDKSITIYWKNVSEERLIKPIFGCFYAYTTYSFTLAIASIVAFVLGEHVLQFSYFFVNVVVLVLLSCKMIDIYYNREQKKLKYRLELSNICDRFDKKKDLEKLGVFVYDPALEEINIKLKEYTIRAIQNSSYDVVIENLDLMGDFAFYLDENNVFFVKNLEGKYLLRSKLKFCARYIFKMERYMYLLGKELNGIKTYEEWKKKGLSADKLDNLDRIRDLQNLLSSILNTGEEDLSIVDDICIRAFECCCLQICNTIILEYINCLINEDSVEKIIDLYFSKSHTFSIVPRTITKEWDYSRVTDYKNVNPIIGVNLLELSFALYSWYSKEYAEVHASFEEDGIDFAFETVERYWSEDDYWTQYIQEQKSELLKKLKKRKG